MKIPTLYSSLDELYLDMAIYGRIVSSRAKSIDELKGILFEEFKLSHPMPTLESKRYEQSEQVSNDYQIGGTTLELQEFENLVDITQDGIVFEDFDITDEITDEVKEVFKYENRITDELREKYLEFGLEEFSGDSSILGSVVHHEDMELSDEQLEALENDTYTEDSDDEDGVEYIESKGVTSSESNDNISEEEQEDDYKYEEEEEEQEDDYEYEEEEEEQEDDYEYEEEEEEQVDDYEYESDEEQVDDYEYEEEDDYEYEEEEEEQVDDYEYEEDEEEQEDFYEEEENNKVVDKFEKEEYTNYKDNSNIEYECESNKDTENNDKNTGENKEGVVGSSNSFEPDIDDLGFTDSVVSDRASPEEKQDIKVEEPVVEEEPKDLRQFLRKHPRCDIDFARKYFSKKEIEKAILVGKIVRRGNKLHI